MPPAINGSIVKYIPLSKKSTSQHDRHIPAVKAMLEKTYDVSVATSGKMAITQAKKKRPDLILLDYEMPEMNGKQVLQKLRDQEEYADIPVVFLTSMDTREIVIQLLALQPAGYILKPVDSQMLVERIEDIIGK